MSNVIKAYSVRYDNETKKTIDTHIRIDKELEARRIINPEELEHPQEGFVEGLSALVVEALPSEEDPSIKEDAAQQATILIEKANKEAEEIIHNAKLEAEKIKKEAFEEAKKRGYEEGSVQSKREAGRLKEEYEEKAFKLKREYEEMTLTLEPQIAQVIAALVEKITGIIVEDKEEVIIYLIDKALKNMDRSSEYTIRVSKEDYDYVSMKKNILINALGTDASLYIKEDESLAKNQCFIETDFVVINCSLDIQLNNLYTDLKLIGSI